MLDQLAEVINETKKNGGNILIPSFAIERSQVILYHLNELLLQGRIPHLMTFVDSPMAVKVTEGVGEFVIVAVGEAVGVWLGVKVEVRVAVSVEVEV